jgi:hypothetical protein
MPLTALVFDLDNNFTFQSSSRCQNFKHCESIWSIPVKWILFLGAYDKWGIVPYHGQTVLPSPYCIDCLAFLNRRSREALGYLPSNRRLSLQ